MSYATGPKRLIFLSLAGFCVCLGTLGAILPLLPTTPFLLLASWLLMRSSPQMHQRLLQSRMLGPILRDWQQQRGITRSVRQRAISIVVLVACVMLYFLADSPLAQMITALGAMTGVLVISCLPVINREK